jgi:hypothetical protein
LRMLVPWSLSLWQINWRFIFLERNWQFIFILRGCPKINFGQFFLFFRLFFLNTKINDYAASFFAFSKNYMMKQSFRTKLFCSLYLNVHLKWMRYNNEQINITLIFYTICRCQSKNSIKR